MMKTNWLFRCILMMAFFISISVDAQVPDEVPPLPPPPPPRPSKYKPKIFVHKKVDTTKIYENPEIWAEVDKTAWRRHLEIKGSPVISDVQKKGMEAGVYTVQVRLLRELNGMISDARSLNDPGFGLALAAVEIFKTGPIWKSAIESDVPVRSYRVFPITFRIPKN